MRVEPSETTSGLLYCTKHSEDLPDAFHHIRPLEETTYEPGPQHTVNLPATAWISRLQTVKIKMFVVYRFVSPPPPQSQPKCYHRLNGHEFEQTPGDGDGQGNLASCSLWGRKESDTADQLNNKLDKDRCQRCSSQGLAKHRGEHRNFRICTC